MGESLGVWDGRVHTVIFKMGNQEDPTVQHRELYSILRDSLDGRGIWGRIDTCKCVVEALYCPETITALLIGYTPVKNKNVRKVFAPVKVPVFFNMNV